MNDSPDSFYVWASSKSSNPSGEPNTPEEFSVNLQHTDQLKGKWEVALAEIEFPNTWFNLKNDVRILVKPIIYVPSSTGSALGWMMGNPHYKYLFDLDRNKQTLISHGDAMESLIVPAGRYFTIEEILGVLNQQSDHLKLAYNKITRKVSIEVQNSQTDHQQLFIEIGEKGRTEFLPLLGFNVPFSSPRGPCLRIPVHANMDPLLELKFPAFFVYCNFIEEQYVGNELKPVLRFVTVPNVEKSFKQIHREFRNRNYLNVSVGYINSISFKICDDTGESMKFQGGYVRAYLHFRQIQ